MATTDQLTGNLEERESLQQRDILGRPIGKTDYSPYVNITPPTPNPPAPKPTGSNPPAPKPINPKPTGGTSGTTSSSLPTGLTQQSSGTYTVKKGDTLGKIARDLGVDVNTIATENNISNPNLIKIGQVLKVRGATVPAPSTSTDTQTTPGAVPVAVPESSGPENRSGTPVSAASRAAGGALSTPPLPLSQSEGSLPLPQRKTTDQSNHERNPNAATPATPATPADPSAGTPAVPATPATPATPANQTAENHRDTVASATPMPGTTVTPATPATPADPSAGTPAVPATPATPATGVGAETNSDGGTYTVVAGDTLFDIARRNGTDYQTLAKINNIANPRLILPGQNIKLPSAGSASVIVGGEDASGAGAAQYTVAAGDTLSQIAEKHGTDYQTLAKINGIKNPDLIHPGQNIKLPDRPMSGGAGLGNETSSAAQPINLSGFSDKP